MEHPGSRDEAQGDRERWLTVPSSWIVTTGHTMPKSRILGDTSAVQWQFRPGRVALAAQTEVDAPADL